MGRNKDYAGIIKDANEKMIEWEGMKVVPESVNMYRELLTNFYQEAGKKVKNMEGWSARVKLTEDQEEELIDIAIGFLNDNRADLSTYEDFLTDPSRTATRARNNVHTLEDAVRVLDELNDYQDDAFLRNVLSSDQLMELYNEGHDKGMTNKEMQDMIFLEYSGAGVVGDDLYEQIWGAIKDYDEKLQGWDF